MNTKLFNVLLFTSGAAIGSLVTWKVLKTKYDRIVQEEIDSVKETWARRMCEESDESDLHEDDEGECDDAEDDEFEDSEVIAYHKLTDKYKMSGTEAENDGEGEGGEEVPYINGPYVIAPEDFADGNYDHDCTCLTYYSDGVLADDWLKKFDIDETIGEDSLHHFDEYTEDVVYVRNERLNADYEVTRDPRTYAEILANDSLTRAYAD